MSHFFDKHFAPIEKLPCQRSPSSTSNIKIPEELADDVDKVIRERTLGYRSRAEFIAEATRQRLIEIKKVK